jgi:hypothetical protein
VPQFNTPTHELALKLDPTLFNIHDLAHNLSLSTFFANTRHECVFLSERKTIWGQVHAYLQFAFLVPFDVAASDFFFHRRLVLFLAEADGDERVVRACESNLSRAALSS